MVASINFCIMISEASTSLFLYSSIDILELYFLALYLQIYSKYKSLLGLYFYSNVSMIRVIVFSSLLVGFLNCMRSFLLLKKKGNLLSPMIINQSPSPSIVTLNSNGIRLNL